MEATCVMGAWERDMTAPGTEATVLVAKVVEAEVLVWEGGARAGCCGGARLRRDWPPGSIWGTIWGARATCWRVPFGIIIMAI